MSHQKGDKNLRMCGSIAGFNIHSELLEFLELEFSVTSPANFLLELVPYRIIIIADESVINNI